MAPSKKTGNERAAGEILLNEVFRAVEQLNATAGPGMVKRGTKSGNMTFSPKIIVDENGARQYLCSVEIYTPESVTAGSQISMEFSGPDTEQFKRALKIALVALSAFAQQSYLSDTYTVGLITPTSDEIEVYAPAELEPGMYSLKEALAEEYD